MTKKKKHGGKKLSAQQLQIEVLRFLLGQPKKRFTPRQITEQLRIENNRDSAEHALQQLVLAGSVAEYAENKFGAALERLTVTDEPTETTPPRAEKGKTESPKFKAERAIPATKSPKSGRKFVEGRVDMTRTGAAYIVTEMMDSDIYVPPKYINGALQGDIVRLLLFPPPPARYRGRSGQPVRKPEGEVVEVLKRNNEFFIGTLRKSRQYALFLPDNPNMPTDIYVPLEAAGNARDGEKVVVRVTDWQEGKGRAPIGKVTQALGEVGGNDFEMKKILINQGFELSHSDEAEAEAARIPETISPLEISMRRDFRDVLTFTIDPEDAKDFDDALSIRQLENGQLEVGVHIADVTHYLKPDSALDREAFQRSTSVYLVDRVCPMLPEKLSNHMCSLVPHEDRLTFSAVFVFDEKDKITSRWFGKTVIHSAHRFAYEGAQAVLNGHPVPPSLRAKKALDELPDAPETVAPEQAERLTWAINTLNRLALKMRKAREKDGAIGFETDEVRFRLAPDGTPLEAYIKARKDAHLLIEDFMLLANKEVALFIDQKGESQQEVPFVYRVHDLPNMEKVAEFARFAAELGVPMKVDTPKQIAQSFNTLMKKSRTDERLKMLEPLAIRTMAKAIYSTKNIGHYGLGFSHYSHFTSPIRRYSDVLAHRILERNLDGRSYRVDKSKLEEQCKHVSAQERKAADAERESIKYKQAEFVRAHIGEAFEGVVSGIIERGLFVELPGSKAEGLLEFRYMDDTYVVEEGNLRAKGRRYKRTFKMGDRVQVIVSAVDMQTRRIELEWVEA
jgi:ribonuclease R